MVTLSDERGLPMRLSVGCFLVWDVRTATRVYYDTAKTRMLSSPFRSLNHGCRQAFLEHASEVAATHYLEAREIPDTIFRNPAVQFVSITHRPFIAPA